MRGLVLGSRLNCENPCRNGVAAYMANINTFSFIDVLYEDPNPEFSSTEYAKRTVTKLRDNHAQYSIQKKVLDALQSYPYSFIECNNVDSLLAVTTLALEKVMPVYFRLHPAPELRGKDKGASNLNLALNICVSTGVQVLTSSTHTQQFLLEQGYESKVVSLPLNIPELKKPKKQSGVLCISRYDNIKRLELFAKIVKEIKAPIKILTNSSLSARKWEKLLGSVGIKDFEIQFNLQGQEKWEFISSAKTALMTSRLESFCFAVLETALVCKTFIVKSDTNWHRNFDDLPVTGSLGVVDADIAAKEICKELKSKYSPKFTAKSLNSVAKKQYKKLLNEPLLVPAKLNTEFSRTLDSGEAIEWSELPLSQRTINNFQRYRALNKVKISKTGRIKKA